MRRIASLLVLGSAVALANGGCLRHAATPQLGLDPGGYQQLAKQIEVPDEPTPSDDLIAATPVPVSLEQSESQDYLDLSLEQAVHMALQNSAILRDLGGTLLRSPDISKSKYDPSVVESDPQSGIEGALSAFDAGFTTNFSNENNDREINNIFFGGGTRTFQQTFAVWQTQLYKKAGTGSQFAVKN